MENTYNVELEDEDNELFMKHVIGEDMNLLGISRYLDKAYAEDEDF